MKEAQVISVLAKIAHTHQHKRKVARYKAGISTKLTSKARQDRIARVEYLRLTEIQNEIDEIREAGA